MSAYTADRAGQEVVADHIEGRDGRDHDEVHVVLRLLAPLLEGLGYAATPAPGRPPRQMP